MERKAAKKVDFNKVHIDNLDEYIQLFYEEQVEMKSHGAQSILYLCLSNENMEIMLEHETLFGTVSRTLRDDYKKSIELTLYLLNIFQAYSNFTQFHEFLITNQIGDTTIKIIDHEIKRYVVRVKEFKTKSENLAALNGTDQYEAAAEDLRKDEKKLASIIKKQEKVLFVAFHLLLNLAEDLQIERKMKNRKIITLLMSMMERNNPDLLFIVLNFLKKLSIFGENKNEMKDQGIIEKLIRFIPCENQLLLQIALRTLFNLSFDQEIRIQMNDQGMIPKLVDTLKAPGFRAQIIKILYHLSLEDKAKATFTYTDCIPLIYQLIIHCPEPIVGKELIGLAVNLTTNQRNADMLAGEGQLDEMIARAKKFGDTLLFKCVRNIAQFNPNCSSQFASHLDEYATMVQQCGENTDLMLELLGTMVYIPCDNWGECIERTGFIDFLQQQLANGYAEDDIILECVMLVATMCRTNQIAEVIAQSYLIKILQDLLGAKQEDDEMVQQILNTFFKFLFFTPTREIVLHQTQMVSIVLELLSDKNPNIKGLVNAILDYVQLHDEMWKSEIKSRRFQIHNSVFLEIMDEYDKQYPIGGEGGEELYDDMYYLDQMQADPEFMQEMSNLDPQQRAAYIQQMRAMAAQNGMNEGFESDDDEIFFDNNELAKRIWQDNELEEAQKAVQ